MSVDHKNIYFTSGVQELLNAYQYYRQHARPEGSESVDTTEACLDFMSILNDILAFGYEQGTDSFEPNPYEVEREQQWLLEFPEGRLEVMQTQHQ